MFKSVTGRVKKFFELPFNKAIDTVAGLFSRQDQLSDDEKCIVALIKTVLPVDAAAREKALGQFRLSLEKQNISDQKISSLLTFLYKVAPGNAEQALPALAKQDVIHQKNVLSNLLALAWEHDGFREDAYNMVADLADKLAISTDEFALLADSVRHSYDKRGMLLRSGTGIVLALIVIAVFVLVATWLSSLLFGLVLAYIFLPLEQYFERQLRKEPGKLTIFLRKINFLGSIRNKLSRKSKFDLSEEEIARRKQQAITTQATTLTVSCVVAVGCAILLALVILLSNYISSLRKDIAEMREKNAAVQVAIVEAPAVSYRSEKANTASQTILADSKMSDTAEKNSVNSGTVEISGKEAQNSFFNSVSIKMVGMLDNLKSRFESLPLVQQLLSKLSDYLADGKAEEQITAMLLKRAGGIFSFIGQFIAAFAGFLLNLLLTFFFFSLFLSKLAGFVNSSNDKRQRASSYLIRTVFNGKWLPLMSEEHLCEGDRIVGEVINKLRIWLRGYMTMIAIDFCVYTTAFVLLGVPYAPILGAIAGVGILLPYIGPVCSALLTVLVTLAVGGADVTVLQIAGIVGIYLMHNGVIEQFFIYPMIIGESLGLTTLETIIVVLLGGIIAGIPGMIFALPVSSVIKYLVPQIYRCWR